MVKFSMEFVPKSVMNQTRTYKLGLIFQKLENKAIPTITNPKLSIWTPPVIFFHDATAMETWGYGCLTLYLWRFGTVGWIALVRAVLRFMA